MFALLVTIYVIDHLKLANQGNLFFHAPNTMYVVCTGPFPDFSIIFLIINK